MLFKENKRKHSINSTEEQGDLTQNKRKQPAWIDDTVKNLKVNINDQSKLRKLKQSEKEDKISGKYLLNLYILTSCLIVKATNSQIDLSSSIKVSHKAQTCSIGLHHRICKSNLLQITLEKLHQQEFSHLKSLIQQLHFYNQTRALLIAFLVIILNHKT